MPQLQIIDSNGKRTTLQLDPGQSYQIGRSDKSDIVLTDLSLSRRHAEITPEGEGWRISDCGSHNGTFVNGERITAPLVLVPGATIGLGRCSLRFGEEPESDEKISFSDEPISREGTLIVAASDVLTVPQQETGETGTTSPNVASRLKRLELIERANMELLAHVPMGELLPKVLDLIVEAVRPDRAALLIKAADGSLNCRAYHGDPALGEMEVSRTIARTVCDDKVSVLTSDAQSDARFRAGESIVMQNIRAVMAAPLWDNQEVIGLIYADSVRISGLFQEADLRLMTMLANIAAIQIANARLFEEQVEQKRLEEEARAAADIQQRLLPSRPLEIPGYGLRGQNTPCYEAGGDYYDFLHLGGNRHGVVLADVAGKGMGAAMLMAALQATYRARVQSEPDPVALTGALNEATSRSAPSNRFITMVLLELDSATHRVRYVNAGHAPEPHLVRVDGTVERIPTGGVPLGILPNYTYPVGEIEMRPGDFLFVCSDGVTDTVDPDDDQFGEERLEKLLASLAGSSLEEVFDTVDRELKSFASDTLQPDDLTFVILHREA